jgi:hypothetical protein
MCTSEGEKKRKRGEVSDSRSASSVLDNKEYDTIDEELNKYLTDLRKHVNNDEVGRATIAEVVKLFKRFKRKVSSLQTRLDVTNQKLAKLKKEDLSPITLDSRGDALIEKYCTKDSLKVKMRGYFGAIQNDSIRRINGSKKSCEYKRSKLENMDVWADLESVLESVTRKGIKDIQKKLTVCAVSRILDSTLYLNLRTCTLVGQLLGKEAGALIFPSGNRIGHFNRQLEEIGFAKVEAKLTEDKLGFSFCVEDFLKLFIITTLNPAGWNNDKEFVICVSLDGTRKSLLNCIIAGLKIGKIRDQNELLKTQGIDPNMTGIHSETFYIPMAGAICKENGSNTRKFFDIMFQQLRHVAENNVVCASKEWKFKFLICTDLKAQWNILGLGGGNATNLHCCPGEKAFKFVPVGLCDSCRRRNPNQKNFCIHTNMHLTTRTYEEIEDSVKITWEVPSCAVGVKTKLTYNTLLAEVDREELEKPHNKELIKVELTKRFKTEKTLRDSMASLHLETQHDLLKHCHLQERTRNWLMTVDEAGKLAMWVDRQLTIPDTLHIELRVGEEILTQVVQVCLMNRTDICSNLSHTKQIEEKTRRLSQVSDAMGFLMSKNEHSNFTITTKPNKPEEINKIAMNNDRLRRVFNGMQDVLDVIFVNEERTVHDNTMRQVMTATSEWIIIRDILRSDADMEIEDADLLQDRIDIWMVGYFGMFPNSNGSYLHMLHKGHIRDYLIIHKNLHRWCNTDSEAHNGFLKHFLAHRCQGNGHKKSAHGKDDNKEFIAKSLMRLYIRRIMWLCDPDAVQRLESAKENSDSDFKKRDVITRSTDKYLPNTFKQDNHNLLNMIYFI